MTTYYSFIPSNVSAPNFMPTFDGTQYNVTIIYNISAQRYYVRCQTLNKDLIFLVPLVESDEPVEIIDYEWDEYNARVVATTKKPHGMPIGQTIIMNIINTKPDAYNGFGFGFVLSDTEFFYPMAQDPGQAIRFGVLDMFISMTKGYFNSTLVYRNKRFEVSP
jgi:hypothetical protein